MPRKAQDVTDAELAILQLLWDRGRATVRDIVYKIYPSGTTSDLATVQKLLKRLEIKDCVRRDRSGWPHVFEASIQRSELIGRRLQTTADELCGGSLTPLLTHLVAGQQLNPEERKRLRELLGAFSDEEPAS